MRIAFLKSFFSLHLFLKFFLEWIWWVKKKENVDIFRDVFWTHNQKENFFIVKDRYFVIEFFLRWTKMVK